MQYKDPLSITSHTYYPLTCLYSSRLLNEKGIQISIWTILRCRKILGWTFRGSAYCQLIRTENKQKRLQWARKNLDEAEDGFDNVIFSDESSVQLESHKRYCCRKKGLPPKNKPRYTSELIKLLIVLMVCFRPKHPPKVHVWAGISLKGPTKICIFHGNMDGPRFTEILQTTLLPFIREKYPGEILCTKLLPFIQEKHLGGHRLMQDNDPKHTCSVATSFYAANNINWWKSPAESPDINPIENMWHELKEFIRSEVKPHTKQELIQGIQRFWKTVDVDKCTRLTFVGTHFMIMSSFVHLLTS